LVVLDAVYEDYGRLLARLDERRHHDPDVDAVRWMIEELRIGLFAQQLGTPYPVSEKRIRKAIAAITR
jgi:ATP-dependent helicase HrpA